MVNCRNVARSGSERFSQPMTPTLVFAILHILEECRKLHGIGGGLDANVLKFALEHLDELPTVWVLRMRANHQTELLPVLAADAISACLPPGIVQQLSRFVWAVIVRRDIHRIGPHSGYDWP